MLMLAGVMTLLAVGQTALALLLPGGTAVREYTLLCVALGMWGAFNGLVFPALDALFADSTPSGGRAAAYTARYGLAVASNGLGPSIAAGIYARYGDAWNLAEIKRVLLVGIGLAAIPAVLLFGFRDEDALGRTSEAFEHRSQARPSIADGARSTGGEAPGDHLDGESQNTVHAKDAKRAVRDDDDDDDELLHGGDDSDAELGEEDDVPLLGSDDFGEKPVPEGSKSADETSGATTQYHSRRIPALLFFANLVSSMLRMSSARWKSKVYEMRAQRL